MANPEEDFEGYMADLAAAETARAETTAQWEAHMIWRNSTLAGRTVSTIQRVAGYFKPFFDAVADALREEKSIFSRILGHSVRLATVFAVLLSVYAFGRLLQMLIGKEILIEEEVEVVEEITVSELEKEKQAATITVEGKSSTVRRRTAKDRKGN